MIYNFIQKNFYTKYKKNWSKILSKKTHFTIDIKNTFPNPGKIIPFDPQNTSLNIYILLILITDQQSFTYNVKKNTHLTRYPDFYIFLFYTFVTTTSQKTKSTCNRPSFQMNTQNFCCC